MRSIFFLCLGIALFPSAQAQNSGIFRPKDAPAVAWSVNENRTLIWNDIPYIPVGIKIDATPAAIDEAKEKGITDVMVRLSLVSDWQSIVNKLEEAGLRYLINVDTIAPPATGVIVDPQRLRITELQKAGPYQIDVPTASQAYVILISDRDGTATDGQIIPAKDGKITYTKNLDSSWTSTLYFFPESESSGQIDCWEKFDSHRDLLLTKLKSTNFGPGFRGLVNPLGDSISFRSETATVVPNSPAFRMELATFLQNRYRNIATALKSWGVGSNSIMTFEELASIVPLWNGSKGADLFWDATKGRTYRAAVRQSSAWSDIQSVIDTALARRSDRLIRSIQKAVQVPVVQDWNGWAGTYEYTNPALAGLGARVYGSSIANLINDAAGAASSLIRWRQPGWLLATTINVDPTSTIDPKTIVDELSTAGFRGFFFEKSANLDLKSAFPESGLETWTTKPIFFPQNAMYPAAAQKLAGGYYWLPSPANGNSIDLGRNFHAYRYSYQGQNFTAIWTKGGSGRVKLRMNTAKDAVFTTLDGTDPNPKLFNKGVEVYMNEIPMIITGTEEVPIPELALNETVALFEELKKHAKTVQRDISTEDFAFKQAVTGFDRNPSGSMSAMRSNYWRANQKVGIYTFIEAESTKKTTFSDSVSSPGASNNQALILRSLPGGSYFAEYNIPVKTEDDQVVWVAARIPDENQGCLTVEIGGQLITLEKQSAVYGRGFSWYKGGVTQLRGATAKLVLNANSSDALDIAIDAILIAPSNYTPQGSFPPEVVGN